ncbi:MAG: hypothetical protein WC466_04130 [Candidatus Izemoplasmatales bacterium]
MEHNGKYIIREFYGFKPDAKLIFEAEEQNKPIIMSGILQKANTLNRNGRVYPYDILRREGTNYMKLVEEGLAGGECDHPDCQTSDSQILTKNGWKYLPDISDDEEILTLNIKTGKVEIQKIEKKINAPYKGDMYAFKGKGIDIITTPNHRFLVQNKKNELEYYTAEELSKINKKHLKLLKKVVWDGVSYEKIKIDAVENEALPNNLRKVLLSKYTKDLQIDAEWFFKFMGFYLADGNAFGVMGGKSRKGYLIQITQKKQKTIPVIREILKNLTPEIEWKEITQKTGTVRFIAHDARLHKYLFKLGNSHEKYIPTELKQASPSLLNLLFQTFLLGDGRSTKRSYYKHDSKTLRHAVFSTSKKLIEDLQEILIKSGGCGNITQIQPKDRIITDTIFTEDVVENGDGTISLIKKQTKRKRLISGKNSHIQYFLNVSITDYTNLERVQIKKIDFNDNVYCVRVENGNFYTMRNGKPFWTGNSAIVSLANISHRIIDMWWQGEELYGKVMIAYTPAGEILKGLLKTGFKLGISSRGVGSVKTVKGEDIVQDDFELIAFDFVSSPSTPGAYMFKENRQWGLTPITEEQYKNIKCENGICRLITSDEDEKIILPEQIDLSEPKNCQIDGLCDGYRKLYNLSNNDFWKKI